MKEEYLPPIFFTSIPKCGKNIINSFLFSLGYEYFNFERADYNSLSNFMPFPDMGGRDHYLTELQATAGINYSTAVEEFRLELCSINHGQLAHRHLYRNKDTKGLLDETRSGKIFLYRDPRDCLLSVVNYARDQKKPKHFWKKIASYSKEEALLYLLDGGDDLIPFARWFDAYYQWLQDDDVVSIRFEDIVGSKGGGDDTTQKLVFLDLVERLGISVSQEKFSLALRAAFNPGAGTFRKGQIGSWRNELSDKVINQFNSVSGDLLERWDYLTQRDKLNSQSRISNDAVDTIVEGLIKVRALKDSYKGKVEELTRKIEKVKIQKGAFQAKFSEASRDLATWVEENEELKVKLSEASRDLATWAEENEELKVKLSEASRDLATLKNQNAALDSELNDGVLGFLYRVKKWFANTGARNG